MFGVVFKIHAEFDRLYLETEGTEHQSKLVFKISAEFDRLYLETEGTELSSEKKCILHCYTPALKKWGVYRFTSVRHSVRPSVIP